MPSPIAHSTMGYVVYRLFSRRLPYYRPFKSLGSIPPLLIISLFFSLMPDFDFGVGILFGNLARYHNNGTHSLIVGLVIAVVVGGAVWLRTRSDFFGWFFLILLSYNMHIVLDFFTQDNRGVMLFWPLSDERYASPIWVFYAVRWSEGWISASHIWTVATETLFALLVVFLSYLLGGNKLSNKKKSQSAGPSASRLPLHEER